MKFATIRIVLAVIFLGIFRGSDARADIVTVFQATGSFNDGSALSGDLTIDVTTGSILSSTLAVGAPGSLDFSQFIGQFNNYPTGGDTGLYFEPAGQSATYPYLVLVLPVGTLVNYQGGAIGSIDDPAKTFISGYVPTPTIAFDVQVGTLTAVPEPSTLVLLGLGVAGAIAIALKKKTI